jgi:hypothetical protein
MNWGKSIILAFVLFAIFIGVLVTVCLKQEVSLVSRNYYQEELEYQDRIESMNNFNRLSSKPEFILSGNILHLELNQDTIIERGTLFLFRPSDGKLDKHFDLTNSTESQEFNVGEFPKGLYHLKLQCSVKSKTFFHEILITL